MRGFQIWSENLNRITFDPLFGKKRSKTGKIPYFTSFRPFLARKGSNAIQFKFGYQAWNAPIIPQLASPICNDLHILIFRLPIAFHLKNDFGRGQIVVFSTKRVIPYYSAWKDAWESKRKHRKN